MAIERRMKSSAWLMLVVYLSMTLLAGLHTHQYTVDDCADCKHYVHHSGHITALSDNAHECVLCQFFSLVYIAAAIVSAIVVAFSVGKLVNTPFQPTAVLASNNHSTRAPPLLFV